MTEWANHAIYEIVEEDGCLVAHILPSNSARITEMRGYEPEEEKEFVQAIRDAYPQGCVRYHPFFFQDELKKRTTHTSEMWEMLFDNWTGNDLTSHYVYASTLRPVSDVRIDGAVGIIAPEGTLYEGRYTIHGYIVHPGTLDEHSIRHFGLVFISKPEGA